MKLNLSHYLLLFVVVITFNLSVACANVANPEVAQPTTVTLAVVTAFSTVNPTYYLPYTTTPSPTFTPAPPITTSIPTTPTLTPTTSLTPTATPILPTATNTQTPTPPVFIVTQAQAQTTTTNEEQLILPIKLDKTNLTPPVQKVIYLTISQADHTYTPSVNTIWQADLQDITQAQVIISFTHRSDKFSSIANLSPNNQYIALGKEQNKPNLTMGVELININQGTSQIIDRGANLPIQTPAFIWSNDSKFLFYTKSFAGLPTEIHQYSLDTKQTTLLYKSQFIMSLVGQKDSSVYFTYIDQKTPLYAIQSYNFENNQLETIFHIPKTNKFDILQLSPNGNLAVLANKVIDLQDKTPIAELTINRLMWGPDSQSIIQLTGKSIFTHNTMAFQTDKTLELSFNFPKTEIELIAWSPDGQYIIYHNIQTDTYHLFNLQSAQTQDFPPTAILRVGGWIN